MDASLVFPGICTRHRQNLPALGYSPLPPPSAQWRHDSFDHSAVPRGLLAHGLSRRRPRDRCGGTSCPAANPGVAREGHHHRRQSGSTDPTPSLFCPRGIHTVRRAHLGQDPHRRPLPGAEYLERPRARPDHGQRPIRDHRPSPRGGTGHTARRPDRDHRRLGKPAHRSGHRPRLRHRKDPEESPGRRPIPPGRPIVGTIGGTAGSNGAVGIERPRVFCQ